MSFYTYLTSNQINQQYNVRLASNMVIKKGVVVDNKKIELLINITNIAKSHQKIRIIGEMLHGFKKSSSEMVKSSLKYQQWVKSAEIEENAFRIVAKLNKEGYVLSSILPRPKHPCDEEIYALDLPLILLLDDFLGMGKRMSYAKN